METNRLAQLCTIIETGSFSKAAEVLGISVGGISKSISVLESELGFELFISNGRGVLPSDFARELYPKARAILDSITELSTETKDAAETFRVGATEVFVLHLMGKLIAQKFSGSAVQVVELAPGALELAVLEGELECGITYLPRPQPGLELLKIKTFQMGAYYVKSHYPDKKFWDIPFIAPVLGLEQNPLGIRERDGWPSSALKRKTRHNVNMLSTALDLSRMGLGAVYMPDFVARSHNQIVKPEYQLTELPLPKSLGHRQHDIFLIKRESTTESKLIKRLVSGIRTLL